MKLTKKELNKLPTIQDVQLGGILARIAFDHTMEAQKGRPKEVLSTKFAVAIKEFRNKQRNKNQKVTIQTSYTIAGGKRIIIPAGLKVKQAINLSPENTIKYWLVELTPEMKKDFEIESWYRNYGFGLAENEVTSN